DPLLTLGCRDPVERIDAIKANDPRRRLIAELFDAWWKSHKSEPVKVNELSEPVKAIADPQGRGRQYLVALISGLAGTHAAGFELTRQDSAGKWNADTYALKQKLPRADDEKESPSHRIGHRTHRTHDGGSPLEPRPYASPYAPPMPHDGP